jgi:hypothetical protein
MTRNRIRIAVLGCLLLPALSSCGESGAGSGGARTSSKVGAAPVGVVGLSAKSSPGSRREIADPQEANSFPVSASVRHAAAATPAKAGGAIVASGAPSDAEVRRELHQMQAVERSAKQAQ